MKDTRRKITPRRHALLCQMLEERRCDVLARLRTLRETPPPAPDERELDGLIGELSREVEWTLAEIESQTLRRIEGAIRHVEDGSYGICAECHADISEARLSALPFAELCHRCQAKRESHQRAQRPQFRFGMHP